MKKILLVIVALLIILVSANAAQLEVTAETITKEVTPGSTASFKLIIKNDQNFDDTFIIQPNEFDAVPFSDVFEYTDAEPNRVDINAKDTGIAIITIKTLDTAIPNKNYRTFVKVKSLRNKNLIEEKDIIINIVSPEELISINTDLPDTIIPGRELLIKVDLENDLNLILDNVEFYIISELFEDNFKLKLFPYQEVERELNVKIDATTKPGKYSLSIKAFKDKKLSGSYLKDFEIIKNPDIKETVEKTSGFFTKTVKITKRNEGNLEVDEIFSLQITEFEKSFMKFNVEPTKIGDNEVEWTIKIKPGEFYTIVAVMDYRGMFIVTVLAAFVIVLILYFKSRKVSIRKSIFKVKDEKGGISELKVLLHIKNRTSTLKNLRVIDLLPNLAHPSKEFGTLKPDRIQKSEHGLRLIWNLPELIEGEERIISYKVESKLHIIGKLVLPPARIEYKLNEKLMRVRSNKIVFLSHLKKD